MSISIDNDCRFAAYKNLGWLSHFSDDGIRNGVLVALRAKVITSAKGFRSMQKDSPECANIWETALDVLVPLGCNAIVSGKFIIMDQIGTTLKLAQNQQLPRKRLLMDQGAVRGKAGTLGSKSNALS